MSAAPLHESSTPKGSMLRWGIRAIIGFLLVALALTAFFWRDIRELQAVMIYANAFKPDVIDDNFRSFHERYPAAVIRRSGPVYDLPAQPRPLPAEFAYEGKNSSVEDWIARTQTTSLLVIRDGVITHERYLRGNTRESLPIAFSVTKSMVAFFIGKALESGAIRSLNDPMDTYAPQLAGGGFKGVSIKDALQMSSGIRFSEDYGDLNSDIVRYVVALLTGSVNAFTAALPNERKPGSTHHYVSANTQALAMLAEAALGRSMAVLIEQELWSRLGAEADAKMLLDTEGVAVSAGGLCARTRDYGRFGLLYLNGGRNFRGEQLIASDWISASVTPDAPHLQPGRGNPASPDPWGYGYHWWIPENPQGDFMGIGIYGQFLYISRTHNTVIVKTSAYTDYNKTGYEMELEAVAAFRAIAAAKP